MRNRESTESGLFFEKILYISFLAWFVIDSLYFANPAMPFLKARQMLCFPFGVTIAKHKEELERLFSKPFVFFTGVIIGIVFMAVTQLKTVKEWPFLVQNLLSLPTLFSFAIAVLALTKQKKRLVENRFLALTGIFAYEVFLIHPYTLRVLGEPILTVIVFIAVTIPGVWLLHIGIRKVNCVWLT